MADLKIGDEVKIKNGGEAKVLSILGKGGQGTVYEVSFENKKYALKYYHSDSNLGKAFYDNLASNIKKGAPNESFLWPLKITEIENGRFGYLMKLRPANYTVLTKWFRGKIKFSSYETLIKASINIVQGFRILHNNGYSYQDLNDGGFFIDFNTGDVLICDNDNVAPYGVNLGIGGKQRYMAPEIVVGANVPDKISDRFSMALILFRMFFIEHPLEGTYSTPPCMTKAFQRKYYGEEPIYIMDPKDKRNRPIKGNDKNLRYFWSVYPEYFKKAFERSFSRECLHKKAPRLIEKEWLDVLFRLKGDLIHCPKCGEELFASEGASQFCPDCKHKFQVPYELVLNNVTIPLFDGSKIMLRHVDTSSEDMTTQIAEVVRNKNNSKLFGIKNISEYNWHTCIKDQPAKMIKKNEAVPVLDGIEKITFTNDSTKSGSIRKR